MSPESAAAQPRGWVGKTEAWDSEHPPLEPGAWYVYVRRDTAPDRDAKVALLAGPYTSALAADGVLPKVRDLACDVDPWCAFDHFGIARLPLGTTEPGRLDGHPRRSW